MSSWSRRLSENGLIPCWTKATVRAILRNPRYTGFNVWNRHGKRRDRPTVRSEKQWARSEQQTHPALVTQELFDMVEERARTNENRQKDESKQQNAPAKRARNGRFYVMRGRCVCDLCNHRPGWRAVAHD